MHFHTNRGILLARGTLHVALLIFLGTWNLDLGTWHMELGTLHAQQRSGEVLGIVTGGAHSYTGEFTSDMWGPGGFISLQYAASKRLAIEGRFGLGEIRWKVTDADIARYPNYFGQGATVGDLYPGSNVPIESQNESRITTADVLLNYVLVPNLPSVPFLSAGVGLINFSPSTGTYHEALPNKATDVYSGSAVTIPVGGGVRIPFSNVSGLIIRGEHRFVFSGYLDDLNSNGSDDAINSISIGLTYTFNPPKKYEEWPDESDVVSLQWYSEDCDYDECCDEECCEDECCDECCYDCCWHHHRHCCCCCCCCCGGGEKQAAAAPAESAPAPSEPAEPEPGPPAEPAARKSFSKDIRFKLDTDEFDFTQPETQKNLQELLTYMKEAPEGHEVIIEGHASGEGPPQRNKVLSDLRAKKIKQWLEEQGVEQGKIRGTVGYGSSMPKVIEPSQEEAKRMSKEEVESIRRQNRRIEVHVLKDGYDQPN